MTSGFSKSLPGRFRGRFSTDQATRSDYARASGPFSLDPAAAAVPVDARDLATLIRWALETETPLVPRGAGTGMPGGNVGSGVVVDLGDLDAIGPVDRDAGTIRTGAGAVAGRVDRAARAAGLFLPALPSSADRCTIGGMVANNAAGARSFRFGSIREWVRELEVVLADGTALRLRSDAPMPEPFLGLHGRLEPDWPDISEAWPKVRKNSSGYALNRFLPSGDPIHLLTGSEGTLAFVTEVTLDLAPLPDRVGLVLLSVEGPEALLEGVRSAGEVGASACEFLGRRFLELVAPTNDPRLAEMPKDAYAVLLVEVAGSDDEVESGIEHLVALARRLGSGVRIAGSSEDRGHLWQVRRAASPSIARAAREGLVSMQFIEDSVVAPERLPRLLQGLDRILTGAGTDAVIFGHAGDGNVHVNPLIDIRRSDWKDRVRGILKDTTHLVSRLGGTLSGEHGDGRVRAPLLDQVWGEPTVAAFSSVKDRLDPQGILNPGVVLPTMNQDPLEGVGTAARIE